MRKENLFRGPVEANQWQVGLRHTEKWLDKSRVVQYTSEAAPFRHASGGVHRGLTSSVAGRVCNPGRLIGKALWCRYFGIADAAIHALVSDGWRGINKDILYLCCQACGKRTTSRAGTPMYRIKTPLHRVAMVMTALSEGVDISAASRISGVHPTTISRWLERAGQHSERLHERFFPRRSPPDMSSWMNSTPESNRRCEQCWCGVQ